MSRDIFADAARRHAHALPGHTLLAAEPCYIPASVLTVDVLAEEAEDLDTAQKYALAAMLNGIDTVEDLELFMGLTREDTATTVAGLLRSEFVDYRPPAPGQPRVLSLLPNGLEAARDAQVRRPKSTTIQVVYDRLTRVVTDWRKNTLSRTGAAKKSKAIILPQRTGVDVEKSELTVPSITAAIDGYASSNFKVLGVTGVTESRNFYRDAILLVYKDIDSSAVRLGIELDGQWSERHLAALEDVDAVRKLGISSSAEVSYEPVDETGPRLSRDEVITIQAALADDDTTGPQAKNDQLDRAAIRWLSMADHPAWLDDALTAPKRRLLIISPWITSSVVNRQFVGRIEQLARSADVTIFWGFGDNAKTDQHSLQMLYDAARRSQRLAVVRVGDTHAKILVSDSYYVKTSFNWLSFRGDSSRKFRQEEGDLVKDQVMADLAYERYMHENCGLALEIVGNLPSRYRESANFSASVLEPTPPLNPASTVSAPPRPSRADKRKAALEALSVGEIVSGTIKAITNFGAFVSLGDIDGLIHISQLADRRVDHPSDVVGVGDGVTVLVQEVDIERERVSLSLRAVPQ
ncbi:S1 RNA-binding domain-containing protein [Rhodococcus aetherivorans]|uniref:S1 RNA-binding domain-containing protein n=1 Tax=Rhodococcus aetherivorans TaxID=191292 RepID=UPI0036808636